MTNPSPASNAQTISAAVACPRAPVRALRRVISLAALALLVACRTGSGSAEESDPSKYRPRHPVTQVTLTDDAGAPLLVQAEVVVKQEDRSRGLKYRTILPEGKGMLFIFQEEAEHPFWMQNTLIPLDMIFISASKKVVGIIHNATPRDETSRSVGVPSLYVLEVPGGYCAKHKVSSGSQVSFDLPEGLPSD